MKLAAAKQLLISKLGFYTLLLLFTAFNLSSHSFAYWPGDSWWLRSAYWVLYLSMALSLIFGIFYILGRAFPCHSEHVLFAVAVLLSWLPFGLAITMVDIATARPETSYAIRELQESGFIPTLLPALISILLPKHLVLGSLIYLLRFYVTITPLGFDSQPKDIEQAPEEISDQKIILEDSKVPVNTGFMSKLSVSVRAEPLLLQAQEHYLSVTTKRGEELILYKFGQAINEISADYGLQVHRSFWVAKQNIKGWINQAPGIKVVLHHGGDVPVSRRFEYYIKQQFAELKS